MSPNNCDRFSHADLVYQSSEQYLILCLKICNQIIKNKCDVELLFDPELESTNNGTSSSLAKKPTASASLFEFDTAPTNLTSLYFQSPAQLLSHLNETECAKYAHKESYKLSLFICGVLLCLLILVLNSLTLFTIIKTRRLHTITNILIANLSASDFLSGVAFLYPCILNLLTINALETYDSYLYTLACNIRQYYYLCLAGYSPMITSMLSSMLTLTLLAFEKYMAILHPYFYERIINERRYVFHLSIFATWTVSILVSALPIMGWNEHNKYSSYRGFNCIHAQSMPCMFERIFTLDYILLFTSICCVCALTMLGIYGRIYLVARKHSRQIAKIHSILNHQQQQQQQQSDVTNQAQGHEHEQEGENGNEADKHAKEEIIEMNKIDSIENKEKKENRKKVCLIKRSCSKEAQLKKKKQKREQQNQHSGDGGEDAALAQSSNETKSNPDCCKFDLISQKSMRSTNSNIVNVAKSRFRILAPRFKRIRIKLRRRRRMSKSEVEVDLNNDEDNLNNATRIVIMQRQDHCNSNYSSSKNNNNNNTNVSFVAGIGSGAAVNMTTATTTTTTTTGGGDQNSSSTSSSSSSTSRSLSMNMKAMKTLLILLLGFYLCWIPLIAYFLAFASKKYNNLTIYILMFVACCNAVIDPLVYAFRNREFYRALMLNFKYFFKSSAATTTLVATTTNMTIGVVAGSPTSAIATNQHNHHRSPTSMINILSGSSNVNNNNNCTSSQCPCNPNPN